MPRVFLLAVLTWDFLKIILFAILVLWEMEECSWIEAAVKVLVHADQPMHYADIKRVILEMGLVPSK